MYACGVYGIMYIPLFRPVTRRTHGSSGALMTRVSSTKPAVHKTISALTTWKGHTSGWRHYNNVWELKEGGEGGEVERG